MGCFRIFTMMVSFKLLRTISTKIKPRFPVVRCFGSFEQEAAHELQATQSSVLPEQPLYNEHEVRKWLSSFSGGQVRLVKNEKSLAAELIIDNPPSRNAFTGKMMIDLAEAVSELENWKSCQYVLVRGVDNQFCTGGDLGFMREICEPASGSKLSIFMQEVTSKMYRMPLIFIALIEGHALGGGAELAVACDFRIMSRHAKIGFVQSHLGVSPGWGGGTHMTRLLGSHVALKLLTTGRILTAEEALNIGLVDHILDNSGKPSEKEALEWVSDQFRNGWIDAIQAAKSVVRNVDEYAYAESLNRERDIFIGLWGGRSHKLFLDHYFTKRKKTE